MSAFLCKECSLSDVKFCSVGFVVRVKVNYVGEVKSIVVAFSPWLPYSCFCGRCFSHSAYWLPTRQNYFIYTVANAARGLLNRNFVLCSVVLQWQRTVKCGLVLSRQIGRSLALNERIEKKCTRFVVFFVIEQTIFIVV